MLLNLYVEDGQEGEEEARGREELRRRGLDSVFTVLT